MIMEKEEYEELINIIGAILYNVILILTIRRN